MRTALTIAGSDSGGGAGIQADLKTFAAHGVFGTTAITALTAQNTLGIAGIFPVPAEFVTAQIEAVAGDIRIDAAKTGMLATAAIVEAVAAAIDALEIPRVVVDPVMVAKSGHRLLDDDAVRALKTHLIGRAYVITPNAAEAAALLQRSVRSVPDAQNAARALHRLGATAVIIKGGHLDEQDSVDVVFDGHAVHELRAPRLRSANTHGIGCTFAAALAANLALGRPLLEAAERSKSYVTRAIEQGIAIGHGHGTLNHFWQQNLG
ncbi:MAG: bifunctional hydroxymethylpyrimidine kinase/phosphomethylpyrimidine kinase [Acidobacteria bacterium]|nr:bifunctional hydroxymethylpyrimidine kinase/phosphomethylpyrimidine kinase [Acidobacteriota bacterium]